LIERSTIESGEELALDSTGEIGMEISWQSDRCNSYNEERALTLTCQLNCLAEVHTTHTYLSVLKRDDRASQDGGPQSAHSSG
jgi:hypothetical protein